MRFLARQSRGKNCLVASGCLDSASRCLTETSKSLKKAFSIRGAIPRLAQTACEGIQGKLSRTRNQPKEVKAVRASNPAQNITMAIIIFMFSRLLAKLRSEALKTPVRHNHLGARMLIHDPKVRMSTTLKGGVSKNFGQNELCAQFSFAQTAGTR